MVKRLINLVNHIDFKDEAGRSIKEYTAWDELLNSAKAQKYEVVTEIKLNGPASMSEVAAALQSITTPIPTRSSPKGPMLYAGKGLYTDDHAEAMQTAKDVGSMPECMSSEPGECIDLEADSRFRKSWEESKALSAEKLIADGREYTLYTDGGPYLKQIECDDPETFELTYDRVLDELLSNPSATGLKVEVTKDKFVATLEYKQ